MIEPCFNELSTKHHLCNTREEVDSCVTTFVNLLKELEQFGVKRLRYEGYFSDITLQNGYTLCDYCNIPQNKNHREFLYSHMRRPYMNEEEEEPFYTYSDYKFVTKDKQRFDCIGLYVSYITKSFSIGFNMGLFKDDRHINCNLSLSQDNKEQTATVCCLTLPRHIDTDSFVELMSEQKDLPVPLCEIRPQDKKIRLPNHHGKDECEAHAKKLVKCKYVREILNSIDFAPSEKDYIHKVHDDNIIEIRLTKTKGGYGLCVSTTANNKIQNHWIAKHLKNNFEK